MTEKNTKTCEYNKEDIKECLKKIAVTTIFSLAMLKLLRSNQEVKRTQNVHIYYIMMDGAKTVK